MLHCRLYPEILCLTLLLGASPVTAGPAAQCGDPKSPAGYFLTIFRDIALNGDLTDRKSLETILETKFDAARETEGGQRTAYFSNTMFGRPTKVIYTQGQKPGVQGQAPPAISLTIAMGPSWPPLSPKDIESCFADIGSKPARRPADDVPGSSWTKPIPRALDGGGRVRVVWSDPGDRNRIDYVALFLDR